MNTRKAIHIDLKDYCYFADSNDFIEVTEWTNGEGVDVSLSPMGNRIFQLTHGEFQALKNAIATLNYHS